MELTCKTLYIAAANNEINKLRDELRKNKTILKKLRTLIEMESKIYYHKLCLECYEHRYRKSCRMCGEYQCRDCRPGIFCKNCRHFECVNCYNDKDKSFICEHKICGNCCNVCVIRKNEDWADPEF